MLKNPHCVLSTVVLEKLVYGPYGTPQRLLALDRECVLLPSVLAYPEEGPFETG